MSVHSVRYVHCVHCVRKDCTAVAPNKHAGKGEVAIADATFLDEDLLIQNNSTLVYTANKQRKIRGKLQGKKVHSVHRIFCVQAICTKTAPTKANQINIESLNEEIHHSVSPRIYITISFFHFTLCVTLKLLMTDISFFVDLLTLLAIFSGVVFGIAEVRRGRLARRDEAALHIFDSPLYVNNNYTMLQIFGRQLTKSASRFLTE